MLYAGGDGGYVHDDILTPHGVMMSYIPWDAMGHGVPLVHCSLDAIGKYDPNWCVVQ